MSAKGLSDNTSTNRGTMIATRPAISCVLMEMVGRVFVPMRSTVDRPVFAAGSMGFEKGILMLIRITCRNKWLNQRQIIERTGFIVPLAGNPKASYTARKVIPRILCGPL